MLCEEQVLARKSLHIQTYHQSVLSHPRSLKTLTRFTRLGVKTVSCYIHNEKIVIIERCRRWDRQVG